MTTLTQGKTAGEFIVSELPAGSTGVSPCRDVITVVSGQTLVAGSVLGKITASGKYAIYDNAAVDGTQAAVGLLFDAVDASAADADGVGIIRGTMEYNLAEVTWNTGALQAEIDAGVADLLALGIIAR